MFVGNTAEMLEPLSLFLHMLNLMRPAPSTYAANTYEGTIDCPRLRSKVFSGQDALVNNAKESLHEGRALTMRTATEQNPREPNSRQAGRETLRLLWKPHTTPISSDLRLRHQK